MKKEKNENYIQQSLFEVEGKEEKDEKKEKNAQVKVKDKNKEPIGTPMIVSYAGHKITINDVKLTPEDIRKKLEKDFPELSKERTEMIVDKKKKLIVPVIRAARKGCIAMNKVRTEHTSVSSVFLNPSPVNILRLKDGTEFEIRLNEIGVFSVLTKQGTGECRGEYREGFVPFLPKIPGELLGEIVKEFRKAAKKHLEMAAQIFFDREKRNYFYYIPRQKMSGTSVSIDRNYQLEQKHLLVMDVHSHHIMSARFSLQDDKDEVETRLYTVVGRLDRLVPDILTRMSCGGKFLLLKPLEVFTINN